MTTEPLVFTVVDVRLRGVDVTAFGEARLWVVPGAASVEARHFSGATWDFESGDLSWRPGDLVVVGANNTPVRYPAQESE